MAPLRTVIVTTPVLLSDLIERAALGPAHLDIIARLGNRRGLPRRLQQLRPDLVVIGLRRTETDIIVTKLLVLLPKAKFIVFSHDARVVLGYELRVRKIQLSNSSPDQVIDFICSESDWIRV